MSIVEAIFPYQATGPNQLSLVPGRRIVVIQRNPGGWWIGKDESGEIGLFPSTSTQPVKEKPKFNVPKETKRGELLQSPQTTSGSGDSVPPQQSTSATTSGGIAASRLTRSSEMQQSAHLHQRQQLNNNAAGKAQSDLEMKKMLGFDDSSSPISTRRAKEGSGSEIVPIINEISELLRRCALYEFDAGKIEGRVKEIEREHEGRAHRIEEARREIGEMKGTIAAKSARLQELEKNIELVKEHAGGGEVVDFAAVDAVADALEKGAQKKHNSSDQRAPSFSLSVEVHSPFHFTIESDTATATPDLKATTAPPSPALFSSPPNAKAASKEEKKIMIDEALKNDAAAAKAAKKLLKRIDEAKATDEEYLKQEAKIEKKIAKYTATLERWATKEKQLEKEMEASGLSSDPNSLLLNSEQATAVEQAKEALSKLEAKNAKLRVANCENERDTAQLHKGLAKTQKKIEAAQAESAQLEAKIESNQKQLEAAEESAKGIEARRKAVIAMVEEAEKRCDAVRGRLAELKEERMSREAEIVEGIHREKDRIAKYEQELAELKERLSCSSEPTPTTAATPTVSPTSKGGAVSPTTRTPTTKHL